MEVKERVSTDIEKIGEEKKKTTVYTTYVESG